MCIKKIKALLEHEILKKNVQLGSKAQVPNQFDIQMYIVNIIIDNNPPISNDVAKYLADYKTWSDPHNVSHTNLCIVSTLLIRQTAICVEVIIFHLIMPCRNP